MFHISIKKHYSNVWISISYAEQVVSAFKMFRREIQMQFFVFSKNQCLKQRRTFWNWVAMETWSSIIALQYTIYNEEIEINKRIAKAHIFYKRTFNKLRRKY